MAWGYETQQRLMWTKVWLLLIMYISSFFMRMLHGVRQFHIFHALDAKTKNMRRCFHNKEKGVAEAGDEDELPNMTEFVEGLGRELWARLAL